MTIKEKILILIIFFLKKKSYENNLIYDISYKALIGSNRLRIRVDKTDGFIRSYNGTRYLTLFCSENYDAIYNTIRALIRLYSDHIYSVPHIFFIFFAKIKIDSYDFLPKEKCLTLYNTVILIQSVPDKDKRHY